MQYPPLACAAVSMFLTLGCQGAEPAPSAPASDGSAVSTPSLVGGGSTTQPAANAPAPYKNLGGDGFVLVKNWDFGTDAGSTIRNQEEMNEHFQYHDQFNTIANGTHYGALIVAPDKATAIWKQPIEGANTGGKKVREFFGEHLRTYLVPLDGATTVDVNLHNAGCGSFHAKWKLPTGGKLLGQDLLWETRVRYVTPPYFWFSFWTAGNKWTRGAETDVVESFGYDNGNNSTNFDGRYWHIGMKTTPKSISYKNWKVGMETAGIKEFDATQWHVWTWVYRADDTQSVYMDGIEVQTGQTAWTRGGETSGETIDMNFIFDGTWGHTDVKSVNHTLPASAFDGKYYDWDYSRVYLRTPKDAPSTQPGN